MNNLLLFKLYLMLLLLQSTTKLQHTDNCSVNKIPGDHRVLFNYILAVTVGFQETMNVDYHDYTVIFLPMIILA